MKITHKKSERVVRYLLRITFDGKTNETRKINFVSSKIIDWNVEINQMSMKLFTASEIYTLAIADIKMDIHHYKIPDVPWVIITKSLARDNMYYKGSLNSLSNLAMSCKTTNEE